MTQLNRLAIALGAVCLLSGAVLAQETTFAGEDTFTNDAYGQASAASADGSVVIVGAPGDLSGAGSAYIVERSGAVWLERQKLSAGALVANAKFGAAVAVEGDWAVVGAPEDDTNGAGVGAAYVFQRVDGTWTPALTLLPAIGVGGGFFGASVGISGTTLAIGAPGAGTGGQVEVYTLDNGSWAVAGTLEPPGAASGDLFGSSLSVSGGEVLVGAPGRSGGQGAAYLFSDNSGSWTADTLFDNGNLGCSGACANGTSVALRGNVAVVGSPGADSGKGSGFLVQRSLGTWGSATSLNSALAGANDGLGTSAALTQGLALLGSGTADGGSGRIYLFAESDSWDETLMRTGAGASDGMGTSVAFGGNAILAGAPGAGTGGQITVHCVLGDSDNDGIPDGCDPCDDARPLQPPTGTALSFSGTQFATGTFSGPTGTGVRTYVIWAKTSSTETQTLFSYGDPTIAGGYLALQLADDVVRVDIGGGQTTDFPSPGTADGKWHHFALVIPDTPGVTFADIVVYQDAIVLEKTTAPPATPIDTTGDTSLIVGKDATSDTNYFSGLLDEFQIWQYPFSRSEILVVIKGQPVFGASLLGSWGFNSTGSVAQDSSPSNNDLNLGSGAAAPQFVSPAPETVHLDPDNDGQGTICDLCFGDNAGLDFDNDGLCADTDSDDDNDGVLDPSDLCLGDDVFGDFDSDGRCSDIDIDDDGDGVFDWEDQCLGDDAVGDFDNDDECDDVDIDDDGDGINDVDDLCLGDNDTGDFDNDGICDDADPDDDGDGINDDVDLCLGDNATGDPDGDGLCNDVDDDDDGDGSPDAEDLCIGDDSSKDTDGDGICNDTDDDDDGDGIPDVDDLCLGNNVFGDTDGDGTCDDLDIDDDGDGIADPNDNCTGLTSNDDADGDGVCDDIDLCPDDVPTGPPSAPATVLLFDGDDRVDMAAPGPIALGSRTFTFWAATPVGGSHTVFAYGNPDTPGAAVTFGFEDNAVVLDWGGGVTVSYPASRVDSGWHHYALVIPPSGGSPDTSTITVYQDAVPLLPDGDPGATAINTAVSPIQLGQSLPGGTLGGFVGFLGPMSIRVGAASQEELETQLGTAPDTSGLLSFWGMTEGTGGTLGDTAGTNDGTLGADDAAPEWVEPPVALHTDTDGDGSGGECDLCFGDDATEDEDGDGLCGDVDEDDDGDGFADVNDLCLGDNASGDTDGDGICDDLDDDDDGDGVLDVDDTCVGDNATGDTDGDGLCNDVDDDDDGDGVLDVDDNCLGDNATGDTDGDGLCDDLDDDDDGDGVLDVDDTCEGDNSTEDIDGDGLCGDVDTDDDGDGVDDATDNCPNVDNPDQADLDDDDLGDACDLDIDGDGVDDADDNCPDIENTDQADLDDDDLGDACDDDVDGDGVDNEDDNCPLVPNPDQQDTSDDGTGDACTGDADGDGLGDLVDNCPEHANPEQEDLDGDETGDACDDDIDGDGLNNGEELALGTDERLVDTDGDGLDDGEEAQYGADPTLSDTDGDGLDDGAEVETHSTDPGVADSDGGGVDDGEEITLGLDPTDPEDDWSTSEVSGTAPGCNSSNGPSPWWFGLLIVALLLRRRNRMSPAQGPNVTNVV